MHSSSLTQATWEQVHLVNRLKWPMHFIMTLRKRDSSPNVHTGCPEHRWNPIFCEGDWMPTWKETWLLGCRAWPQRYSP